MDGAWLCFANLPTQHFFERLGEGYYPQSLCAVKGRESGPIVKGGKKPLCRICYVRFHHDNPVDLEKLK